MIREGKRKQKKKGNNCLSPFRYHYFSALGLDLIGVRAPERSEKKGRRGKKIIISGNNHSRMDALVEAIMEAAFSRCELEYIGKSIGKWTAEGEKDELEQMPAKGHTFLVIRSCSNKNNVSFFTLPFFSFFFLLLPLFWFLFSPSLSSSFSIPFLILHLILIHPPITHIHIP